MKLLLMRHGATKGNLEYRYLGSTDEDLIPEELERLQKIASGYDPVMKALLDEMKRVYISPMLRCRHTASILLPEVPTIAIPALRECEFGAFEYMNYSELNGNPDYQRFIDSGGTCGFPGGETQSEFIERIKEGFLQLGMQESDEPTALVVHGGTIMALLSVFGRPERPYFDWQIRNGEAFSVIWDGKFMTDITKIEIKR